MENGAWRGTHDHSDTDPALQMNLVRSPTTGVTREENPPVPEEIAALIRDVSSEGKLVE